MPNSAKTTRLVIVESPAKAKTISGYLGPGYVVEASFGHVRDLPRNAADVPAKYKGESWARLGVDVEIREEPFGVPMTTPFPDDREHAAWDRAAVGRYFAALDWTDRVLEEFSGWFRGKTSPVHLFWHSFDLAVSRFSGRPAPPLDADAVTREAYADEVISFGFWAGDDTIAEPSFYSYTAPEPAGLRGQPLTGGAWIDSGTASLALLPYEAVRTAADPRRALLGFLQSAYEAGARAAGWDAAALESSWCPTPTELEELVLSAGGPFGRRA